MANDGGVELRILPVVQLLALMEVLEKLGPFFLTLGRFGNPKSA
jgi:hypothetical protein